MKTFLNKYKSKLIKKYIKRTTEQNFITIDDYLAVEMSKGPNEQPGNINYNFQKTTNIYNFISIISSIHGLNKILCMPDFFIKYKNFFNIATLIYFTDTKEIVIPIDIIEELKKCRANTNTRFIYCSLGIDQTNNTNQGHVNIIIIDLLEKTIERFEPFGHYININNENLTNIDKQKIQIDMADNIDYIINKKFKYLIGLDDFKYLTPIDISPLIGPQYVADEFTGMCVSYSILYLHLRLLNPDVKQKKVVEYLTSHPKNILHNIILRYAKYIEITLKKYDNVVLNTNKILTQNYQNIRLYVYSSKKENKYIHKRNINTLKQIFN